MADDSVWFDLLPAWFRRWMSFVNQHVALGRRLRANIHAQSQENGLSFVLCFDVL